MSITSSKNNLYFKETKWRPTEHDNQTPCPMLNTLSNYGILPKKNITTNSIKIALQKLNCVDDYIISGLANIFENNYKGFTNNLNEIGKHGIIEHDVSITRKDYYNGDNIRFNKKRFDKMKTFSKDGRYLTFTELAKYAVYQQKQSKKNNSKLNFGINQMLGSVAEQSVLYLLFRDNTDNIRIDWIEYFFTKEKLPFKKGFVLHNQLNTFDIIQTITKFFLLELMLQ